MRRRCILALALAALLLTGPAGAEAPSAFELLETVRQVYAGLSSYSDRGRIEILDPETGSRRLEFRTRAAADGSFDFRLQPQPGSAFTRVLWRRGDESFVYDAGLAQYKPIDSPLAELVATLGPGCLDALVVPALLTGFPDALPDPEAATVDGPEACGDARCWVLSASRMAGAVQYELWIDQGSLIVRRVEVRLPPLEAALEGALGQTATAPGTARTLRVHHEPEDLERPEATSYPTFEPPPGARRVAAWQGQPEAEFFEEIQVELVTVVVRALDPGGRPLSDLGPDDFRVRVGGQEVAVESADWVTSPTAGLDQISQQELFEAGVVLPPPGRLVVLFVQADFEPVRVTGHLRMLPEVERLVESLPRDDRVAVVSFDSHLKLRQDFSRDRSRLDRVLWKAIRRGDPPAHRPGPYPSLARHLDVRQARQAASPEQALEVTARALAPFPGEKLLIFLGWGLGRYGFAGVTMTPDYSKARQALAEAGVTVFVLDVTDADFHSLEIGLEQVAEDTGGIYTKTHTFPSHAVKKVTQAMSGYYVLSFQRPDLAPGRHRLRIDLPHHKGQILTRTTHVEGGG